MKSGRDDMGISVNNDDVADIADIDDIDDIVVIFNYWINLVCYWFGFIFKIG
jgi:hypothetical protein